MANYTKVVTDAGLAKLTEIANASGTLVWTAVKAGDGIIGVGDPGALTDIIAVKQTFTTIDVRYDSNGVPFIYYILSNDGLAEGYLRREIGVYGRMEGDAADTLILYLYAATDPEADYIPVPEGGIAAISTFRAQIAQAAGLNAEVTVDHSTVYLSLDRWTDHLAGAGGADQHPVATDALAGLMAAADKTKLDAHINPGAPTSGATIHAGATGAVPGFMSAADKTKLDGIQNGAQTNIPLYRWIKVGSTIIQADLAQSTLEFIDSTYIELLPNNVNDTIEIKARNITPSSHIGSRGAAHSNATTTEAGFMAAADKTKLDGVQAGAQVNQNSFAQVKVGGVTLQADQAQDILELIAGPNIALIPNEAGDSVYIAVVDVATSEHIGSGGAAHSNATDIQAGFMAPADRARYRVWFKTGNQNELDDFAAGALGFGVRPTSQGEIELYTKDYGSLLYRVRVRVNNPQTFQIPIHYNDDDVVMYVCGTDGVSTLIDTLDGPANTLRYLEWTPEAGDYTVSFVLQGITNDVVGLMMFEWWGNGAITFLGVPNAPSGY